MQCFALDKLTGSADVWLLSIYNLSLCEWKCMKLEDDLVLWWGAIALEFSFLLPVSSSLTRLLILYLDYIRSSLLRPALFLPHTYSTPQSLLRASEVSYCYSITFAPYTHSSYGWTYHCALFTPHFPFWKCCRLKMHSPKRKTASHLLHNAKQKLANISVARWRSFNLRDDTNSHRT